jgi:hypothetical protein
MCEKYDARCTYTVGMSSCPSANVPAKTSRVILLLLGRGLFWICLGLVVILQLLLFALGQLFGLNHDFSGGLFRRHDEGLIDRLIERD